MKPANTCLILGAGASLPYGYPLGEGLAREIIDLGKAGQDYWAEPAKRSEVKNWARSIAAAFEAARRSQLNLTIDAFLEGHQKREGNRDEFETALMMISEIIRKREKPKQEIIDWYQILFEHIERSTSAEYPWPLKVVTFNYDRSLEYRIARYHAHKMGLLQEEARRWLLDRVSILHVYGDVGPLPDGHPKRDDFAPEYGDLTGWQFWKGRETIKIIRQDDKETYEQCQQWVDDSEYIIILGFGYDELNCKRLGFTNLTDRSFLFTTAFDGKDRGLNELGHLDQEHCYLGNQNENCFDFLLRTKVLTWALQGWSATELSRKLAKTA